MTTSPDKPIRAVPDVDGDESATVPELQQRVAELEKQLKKANRASKKADQLRPYQVELLKLQKYLEDENVRMIVLFEGRDAAGKGGTIRRVTRYMNEKHYRVVALGKPTEEQRHQWYFQKYVSHFPAGGKIVLFDRYCGALSLSTC